GTINTSGRWCTSDGSKINCSSTPPVLTETDPQVGTINTSGRWCTSDGSKINCSSTPPVLTENDPVWNAAKSSYAPLASPTFTGTPKAPTAATSTNNTQIATTAYVKSQGYITSATETDPEVGIINTSGKWCTSDGSKINCSSTPPPPGKWLDGTSSGDIYYSGGDVGIGKVNPTHKLDVAGDIDLNGSMLISGDTEDGTNIDYIYHDESNNRWVFNSDTTADNSIGTSSVVAKYFRNARGLYLRDWDDDTGGFDDKYRLLARDGAWQFYNGGVVVGGGYANGTWSDLADGTLIVKDKIGIDVTSPAQKLDVNGDIRIRGEKSCNKLITDADGDVSCGTDAVGPASIWSTTSPHIYWNGGGNVAVGTSSPYGSKFIVNSGNYPAAAIGSSSYATENYAVAMGYEARAGGVAGMAFGYEADVQGNYSVAIGQYVRAGTSTASGAVAIGTGASTSNQTRAIGYNSMALGYTSVATGNTAISIGQSSTASGDYSMSIGNLTDAKGDHAIVLGYDSEVNGNDNLSIGSGNLIYSGSDNSIALGQDVTILGDNVLAIGLGYKSSGTWYTSSSNVMTIMGGNVGIGTVSPGKLLTVDGDMYANNFYLDGYLYDDDDTEYYINPGATSKLSKLSVVSELKAPSLVDSNNTDMVLNPSSYSYINHLRVWDQIWTNTIQTEGTSHDLSFPYGEQWQLAARTSGGGYNEVFKVQEDGDVYVSGTRVHTSDRRLKDNINDLTYGLDAILRLNPVSFNYKTRDPSDVNFGLIAQDVQPIVPEIVYTDAGQDENMLGISYEELIPILINAVKEQNQKIELLEERIKNLEK
ncbi:tail fiber domain-containing protein, partial [Candidatus Peregrinibacteria bacterium]|nr:tail fiber domain-containing protein [Candidatus Peregrinibacteria bacterium]